MSRKKFTLRFEIEFDISCATIQIAASLSEFERFQVVKDMTPVDAYEDLVAGVRLYLEAEGFQIDRDEKSEDSESQYISYHRIDKETDTEIACEFHIRLSLHLVNPPKPGDPFWQGEYIQKKIFKKKITHEIEAKLNKIIIRSEYKNLFAVIKANKNDFTRALDVVTKTIQDWVNDIESQQ